MKVVLDTNVLLAGFATHGLCETLIEICFQDHTVVISQHILDELAEHYRSKFKASDEQIETVLSTLREHAEVVEPMVVPVQAFADADDLPVLGTALAGQATIIITGDKKLAGLGHYQGVELLSPRQFYDRLAG